MKRVYKFAALLIAAVTALSGCLPEARNEKDMPPEMNTPEPPALDGIFAGEYGTLTFNGDGESVTAEFVGEAAESLPRGDMGYGFYWKNFGKCRYDAADNFKLEFAGESYRFNIVGKINNEELNFKYMGSDPVLYMTFRKTEEQPEITEASPAETEVSETAATEATVPVETEVAETTATEAVTSAETTTSCSEQQPEDVEPDIPEDMDYDGPPDVDGSEYDELVGFFEGEYGTLAFNGDGASVTAEFLGEAAEYLESGETEYSFWWESFGTCPYYEATEMMIGEETLTVNEAREDKLVLRLLKLDDDLNVTVDLEMTFLKR